LAPDPLPPTRRTAAPRSELSDDIYGLINGVSLDDPVLTPASLRTDPVPLFTTGGEDELADLWPARRNRDPR
ncbi:MAG TPA: hypothetical protein VM533_08470, partial [Fimbriiglobus sp.]|nr:hypothetical protein [Fimbriiglobus sp.]